MSEEPLWKYKERVVGRIEATLCPGSTVVHDVKLPVIGHNRTRQCDNVVYTGQEPRRQFTLVEVQKRDRKPNINTFGWWVGKMNEVGANGLICVSESGFPKLIIEKVQKELGPKVRLITLSPLSSTEEWADRLGLDIEFATCNYDVRLLAMSRPVFVKDFSGPIRITRKSRCVSANGRIEDAVMLEGVLSFEVSKNPDLRNRVRSAGGQYIKFSIPLVMNNEHRLFLHQGDRVLELRNWDIIFECGFTQTVEQLTVTQWSYVEEFKDDTIAWLATTEKQLDNCVAKLGIIYAALPDGSFHVQRYVDVNSKRILEQSLWDSPDIPILLNFVNSGLSTPQEGPSDTAPIG